MGTIVTIDVYTSGDVSAAEIDEVRRQLIRARAVLQRADEVFSIWQPGSAISRLRAREITVADAPEEVADVLSRCAAARELSCGWFDPWAMPGGNRPDRPGEGLGGPAGARRVHRTVHQRRHGERGW